MNNNNSYTKYGDNVVLLAMMLQFHLICMQYTLSDTLSVGHIYSVNRLQHCTMHTSHSVAIVCHVQSSTVPIGHQYTYVKQQVLPSMPQHSCIPQCIT